MTKVTVMYPSGEGITFDFDYYIEKHFALVRERLGPALLGITVDKGLNAGMPGSTPAYVAIGHLLFDSPDSFYSAFLPHMGELQGDIPKFTNSTPVFQISEVAL